MTALDINTIDQAIVMAFFAQLERDLDLLVDLDDEDDLERFADSLSLTRDSFAHYAVDGPRRWSECSGRHDFELDGRRGVAFERVQAAKGKERIMLAALDLGDATLLYQF